MTWVLVAPGEARPGVVLPLDDDEAHHLRVRRAADGERAHWADGAGQRGEGVLRLSGKRAALEIASMESVAAPMPLVLGVAAGDRDRWGWLAEKATELGVSSLVPLETERTASVATRVREGQLDRLRRRAREAVKQCGNPWAATVEPPVPLPAFLARAPEGNRWIADRGGRVATGTAAATTVLIGPEGGWTPAERAAAQAAHFVPLSLGDHVLRFETAALAAAVWCRTGGVPAAGG